MGLTAMNHTERTLSHVKTLDEMKEPKRPSLLIDYSKHKASISNTKKANILNDLVKNQPSVRSTSAVLGDRIDPLSTTCTTRKDPFNESIRLEDVQQVSFRVRKSCIRRSRSLDERRISTYDNLQNSIRGTLLMPEESSDPATQPIETPKSPAAAHKVDLRQTLADVRRKHQSMRSLSSTVGNISRSPMSCNTRRIRATPKDALSQTMHESSYSRTNHNLATLASTSKCKSCRHLMRQCKSQNEIVPPFESSLSSLCLDGVSTSTPQSPSRRSALANMKSKTMSRRSLMNQTMSRRHLMDTSISTLKTTAESESESDWGSSMIFSTGTRIRRHNGS